MAFAVASYRGRRGRLGRVFSIRTEAINGIDGQRPRLKGEPDYLRDGDFTLAIAEVLVLDPAT